MDHLSTNTLYGSFLHIKAQLTNNAKLLEQWTREGGAAFSQADKLKTAVIVSFTNKPSADMCLKLRALGLKWNAIRKEWQGNVILEDAQELLLDQDAVLQEVKH